MPKGNSSARYQQLFWILQLIRTLSLQSNSHCFHLRYKHYPPDRLFLNNPYYLWKTQIDPWDKSMPVNVSGRVNTPVWLKKKSYAVGWDFWNSSARGEANSRHGCCAEGCLSLLLQMTAWGNSVWRRQRDFPGTQGGLSYCNHRANNNKKKIREEVGTGHCVPMAGRSEISCTLLWVNEKSTTDGCWVES